MKLFNRPRGSFTLMSGVLLLTLIMAACGSANTGTTTGSGTPAATSAANTNGKGCTKVGVLLPETATSARWDGKDKPYLTTDIQAISGVTVDYYNAQGVSATQQNQADQALTKGDCILVVAPNDSAAAAAIVTKAKASGVPVIAYDRIIQSKDLNYYVSFDNEKVGQLQGQYILDHYKDFVKGTGKNNISLINGAQTDQNAILFNKGVEETLKPLFDNKTLNKVYDQFTPNWDNPTAQTEMEGVLTKYANNVQIAYVANDGMASTVIAALKAQHLNGHVLVTGQDATDAGIHNILTGDQSMTVYKAILNEAQATADIVKALHDGTAPTTTGTSQTSDGGSIPSVLETPVAVDKTNILTTVVKDNYIDKATVCAGLPAGDGGVC